MTADEQPRDRLADSPARLYDALWLLKASRYGDDAEFPTLPEVRAALEAVGPGSVQSTLQPEIKYPGPAWLDRKSLTPGRVERVLADAAYALDFLERGDTENALAALRRGFRRAPVTLRAPTPLPDALQEPVAEAIYDAMRESDPEGRDRPWLPGGNSLKQDEARRRARAALQPAQPTPEPKEQP